jgi:ribonuclease R
LPRFPSYNRLTLRRQALPPEQDILSILRDLDEPASARDIAEALHADHGTRRALPKILARLSKNGLIEEIRRDRFRIATPKTGERHGRAEKDRPRHRHVTRSDQAAPESQRFLANDPNTLIGRLIAHRDGYGFVVPEKPRADIEGDIFIPPGQMKDAMHGDRVATHIERRDHGRGGGGRAEGRILTVLERAHATVVGIFHYGHSGNFVSPYETRLTQEIVIPPGDELTPELKEKSRTSGEPSRARKVPELDGAVVEVALTRFPHAGVAPAGRVTEILGRPGDFGVDVEIMIRKHHLPHRFSDEALADARRVARPVSTADLAGRRDFRDLPIVTIDGETARDFDDAVYVEKTNSGWLLQVHIADVAHYVTPNAPLDVEARLRGNSVYFPNRAVPMLPEELSNGICSLRPDEDRLVMSVLLEFDMAGDFTGAEFTAGVIRSAARMTYTNVNKVIESDPEMSERYAHLANHFRDMRDLALILHERRSRRGSIDFDLPEPVIQFDEQGVMTSVVRSERNIAHRLIEEFMLAANRAVAHFLAENKIESLHRVHEKPDPKKVLEFEELAQAFGYSLGVPDLSERRMTVRHGAGPSGRGGKSHRHGWRGHKPSPRDARAIARSGRIHDARSERMVLTLPGAHEFAIQPQHYQRLAEKIAGKPEERIISYLMLRSLKQARYAADPLGHFALAFDHYTHFTSPIRRYPDLIVHRLLKYVLSKRSPVGAPGFGPVNEQVQKEGASASASFASVNPPQPSANSHSPDLGRSYARAELESIGLETSETERRAITAERELLDWKRAQFMEQHLGEEYDALIISIQKFGFFVELTEVFIEGLVPLQRLEEESGRCVYRERDHTIVCSPSGRVGRSQRIFKLGDRLRVCAERIDPMRRRVEFSPIG